MLQVKDLRNGTTLPERMERVTSVAWASDNQTLFYTIEDETTKRSHRLYRHVLGNTEPDLLLYEETDERFRIEVERARSGAFLLLTILSHTASEVRYLRADQPTGEFQLIASARRQPRILRRPPSRAGHERGGRAILHSNEFRRPHVSNCDCTCGRPTPRILARDHSESRGRYARCRSRFQDSPRAIRTRRRLTVSYA